VFIVTLVLFLLPCSILWVAWKRSAIIANETGTPSWREYFGKAGLTVAVFSTLLELIFFFSWFHNGGSPHGMLPSPGLWKFSGRIAFLVALPASVVLSSFGKGKWRLLILAWAGSLVLVAYVIFMLERD
jgi:hypothetical protein